MAIQGINNAASAITAFGTKVSSTAENIANAQSQKFKKAQVIISEKKNSAGVKTDISRTETPGAIDSSGNELSNVDIAEEISSMISTSHGLKANVKTVQAMDEMTGTIINIIQ